MTVAKQKAESCLLKGATQTFVKGLVCVCNTAKKELHMFFSLQISMMNQDKMSEPYLEGSCRFSTARA